MSSRIEIFTQPLLPEETSALKVAFEFPESPPITASLNRACFLFSPCDRCRLNLGPRGCRSHTCGPARSSSRCRQWARWLTEVMIGSRPREGFPPEIQLACAGSKTTRASTNPTQHHRHVAPRRQGQQSAWWISALTRFSSSGPIRKKKYFCGLFFSYFIVKFSLCLCLSDAVVNVLRCRKTDWL